MTEILDYIKIIGIGTLIAFFVSQLTNVILSTMKSVITVRGSIQQAAIINTVSYTINAGVISQISKIDNIFIVCAITAITNYIGVSFSLWLLEKIRKAAKWRISVTVGKEQYEKFIRELHDNNIDFITFTTEWKKKTPVDVISKTREESKLIKKIFKKYDSIEEYTIAVSTNYL